MPILINYNLPFFSMMTYKDIRCIKMIQLPIYVYFLLFLNDKYSYKKEIIKLRLKL